MATSSLRHFSLLFTGADDRARTGDLDLGKVALYQLSYVRVVTQCSRFDTLVQSLVVNT